MNEISEVLMFNRFECTNLQFWIVGAILIIVVMIAIYFMDTWITRKRGKNGS